MARWTRREILVAGAATVVACITPGGPEPEDEAWIDDGPFPYPESCQPTAEAVEGPFYRTAAPQRSDLMIDDDVGTPLTLRGAVFAGDCAVPMPGAVLDFWHAGPDGDYDNDSTEMRYRGRVIAGPGGEYGLQTLLPGFYRKGSRVRPRHIHVKVFDDTGAERLTTQLFFAGDPHLVGDAIAHTSLVLPFTGSEATTMVAEDVYFVLE